MMTRLVNRGTKQGERTGEDMLSYRRTSLVDVRVALTDANWAVVWVDVMAVMLVVAKDAPTAVRWVELWAVEKDVTSVANWAASLAVVMVASMAVSSVAQRVETMAASRAVT